MHQERQITVPGNSEKQEVTCRLITDIIHRTLRNTEKSILDIDFNVKMNKNVTHYNDCFLSYSKILSLSFIELLLGSLL